MLAVLEEDPACGEEDPACGEEHDSVLLQPLQLHGDASTVFGPGVAAMEEGGGDGSINLDTVLD